MRSARAGRAVVPPMPDVVVSVEPLAPDDDPAVPLVPMPVLPVAAVPPVAPVLPEPPAVPVVPMGVPCELCWPAPVAALGLAVVGGVPWAMAVPTTATVARLASSVLRGVDAVISETP